MTTRILLISSLLLFVAIVGILSANEKGVSHSRSQHFSLRTTRQGERQTQQQRQDKRRLQGLVTAVVNSLVSIVTPTLSNRVQYLVTTYFDTYDFWDYWPYQSLGQVPLTLVVVTDEETETEPFVPDEPEQGVEEQSNVTVWDANATNATVSVARSFSDWLDEPGMTNRKQCLQNAQAQLDWKVAGVTGVGGINIESIALVPRSQDIDLRFQRLQWAAQWSGQWLIVATFPSLTAMTMTQLTPLNTVASAESTNGIVPCNGEQQQGDVASYFGMPQDERELTVNGTITFSNVRVEAKATILGNTDRIFLFPTTSELSKGTINAVSFSYESMDATQLATFSSIHNNNLIENDFSNNINSNHQYEFQMNELNVQGVAIQSQLNTYLEGLFIEAMQEEIDYILPRPLIYEP